MQAKSCQLESPKPGTVSLSRDIPRYGTETGYETSRPQKRKDKKPLHQHHEASQHTTVYKTGRQHRMTDYVRPSDCDRCVPVESIATSSGLSWIVETAHQIECPNAPQGVTE